MNIGIYTLILPRIEVFFLKEWISHHLDIGVGKVWIYDNGTVTNDTSRLRSPPKVDIGNGGMKWRKKPDLDYSEHLSDDEIQAAMLDEIAECEVSFVTVPLS